MSVELKAIYINDSVYNYKNRVKKLIDSGIITFEQLNEFKIIGKSRGNGIIIFLPMERYNIIDKDKLDILQNIIEDYEFGTVLESEILYYDAWIKELTEGL